MKVLCMENPEAWKTIAAIYGGSFPKVLDECTVKETRRCACGKHDVYELEEFYIHTGFPTEFFAILPEADADEMNAAEQEAIVPAPMMVESDPFSKVEKALAAYYQIYELTGCEYRAATAYYDILNDLPC